MKGILLAGGLGTRLYPLTKVTNKHLLPIFDQPMIYYPINTLVKAGVDEILLVISGPFAGDFVPILKNGEEFGLKKLEYCYQEKPDGGIADALALAEKFAEGESIAVILGDNTMDSPDIEIIIRSFDKSSGCCLFLKEVINPEHFGVASFAEDGSISTIIEKPKNPSSNFAVIGLYLYDNKVFDYIRKCKPSDRNQLEITSVNNFYLEANTLKHFKINGFWQDAGSFNSLFAANKYWAEKNMK